MTQINTMFTPDFSEAHVRPSPNFGVRKNDQTIDMIILHYTAMETAQAACDWLCAEESEVSSHYLVDEAGQVIQMVQEQNRAWHAGAGSWCGQEDVNSRSIGIEIANLGHEGGCPAFLDVQIKAVIALCQDILTRYDIPREYILGHSDIAPSRKRDPGEWFPWGVLHQNNIGHFVEPTPITSGRYFVRGEEGQPIEALQSMLAYYGYGVEVNGVFDDLTEQNIIAFQRHFRPEKVDGVADMSTIDTLHRLIKALPISE